MFLDTAKGLTYGVGKATSSMEDAPMTPLEDLAAKFLIPPSRRRVGGLLLLLLVGWLDYITGPKIAFAPFYILVLLGIAFYEQWGVCLCYSGVAALVYLGAELLWTPTEATLVYPYWRAVARLFSFALVSSTISQLVVGRRQLRVSERALQEKTQELGEKNRGLEESMRELKRLQGKLVAKERQAAIVETIYSTTYEIERPLVSISVYTEELRRTIQRTEERHPVPEELRALLDDIQPLLEKVEERARDMEGLLENIREVGKAGRG